VRIVQLGLTTNGAMERGWCSPEHAALDGWPWLTSETGRRHTASTTRATG
jgi:hypothetical protein